MALAGKRQYEVDLFSGNDNQGSTQRPGPQGAGPKGGAPEPSEAIWTQCYPSDGSGGSVGWRGHVLDDTIGSSADWDCQRESIE